MPDAVRPPAPNDDPFVRPVLAPDRLDRYIVRAAILRELTRTRPALHGRLLDVGCGQKPYRDFVLAPPSGVTEYVGLDMPTTRYGAVAPDVVWDGRRMPLADESFDCALATEVLEHCADPGGLLDEVRRVLRPGGLLFFSVPFLWPLHETPHDEYRYTPFALTRIVGQAGFVDLTLHALGGWDASLGQMIGLWVRRRPMRRQLRAIASRMLTPVVGWLARRDVPPTTFGESTMISGLCGLARKGERAVPRDFLRPT